MRAAGRSSASPTGTRKRVRFGSLPRPAERIEVPYGKERPELQSLSCGELTDVVAETAAFREEIGSICLKLDAARRGSRGPSPAYSASECELVLLYQRVCGLRSYKEARDRLSSDRGIEARRIFGLDRPRERSPERRRVLLDGIPSEATISRHRKRFGERRRRGAYERLARRLVREHLLEFPEMREEARIAGIDGSKIETHYTAPKRDKKGKVVNPGHITCRDGGWVPLSASTEKSGHGYNLITMATMSGLPLAWRTTPLNCAEAEPARELLERDYARSVRPHLDQDKVHLLMADGAFRSHALRRTARETGLVEQIHHVSHSKRPRSWRNAEKHDAMRIGIHGYPNWFSNGHYELSCHCGQGKVSKKLSVREGQAVVRSEGQCRTCGPLSITSGGWRRAQNPDQFVRCRDHERGHADWAFGNPLTFNDPLARLYGRQRYAQGEGLHGHLTTRFQLLKGKRWFRRADQARTDTAIVYSIMHSLAIEQRRRKAAGVASSGPPGDG